MRSAEKSCTPPCAAAGIAMASTDETSIAAPISLDGGRLVASMPPRGIIEAYPMKNVPSSCPCTSLVQPNSDCIRTMAMGSTSRWAYLPRDPQHER